jgi:hypothetical protein
MAMQQDMEEMSTPSEQSMMTLNGHCDSRQSGHLYVQTTDTRNAVIR